MKNQLILSGSISKKEIVVPIEANILENTFVTEATKPYANYYGSLPQKANPNSIFFHTQKFYFLEEILSFSQSLEKCLLDKINIASSHVEFKKKQYPAIRIKSFPDYSQITTLQQCFISHGVELTPKLIINGEVETRVNKLFYLEEIEPNLFMDLIEEHKGYFVCEKKILPKHFEKIMNRVKNNTECRLFDAVQGEILKNGNVIEVIRIFAEGLDLPLLKCLKERFQKLG
jgi:hypothetical protein